MGVTSGGYHEGGGEVAGDAADTDAEDGMFYLACFEGYMKRHWGHTWGSEGEENLEDEVEEVKEEVEAK